MNVAGIAIRSLRQRRLSTFLTALGVALGVALVVFVVTVRDSSRKAFDDAARGYDVVIGGIQTSSLATVLSTIFHADQPIDTIDVATYDDLRKDPRIAYAVPYAVGDTYQSYRIVGTTPEFFDAITDATGKPLRERISAGGRVFGSKGEFEAVVGSMVSARTGLKIGSTFHPVHGMEKGGHEHHETWTVVGILEPTGTPNDRALFITLDSFFQVEGHERHDGGAAASPGMGDSAMGDEPADHDHDGDADHDHDHDHGAAVWAVSSVVIRLKSPALKMLYMADVAKRKDVRPANPVREISRLFETVQNVDTLLRWIALLVLVVAGLSILTALYNTIHGRRREIAVLRALGARPGHVFSVVVIEAVLICALGGLLGLAIGQAFVAIAAPILLDTVGIRIGTGPADLTLSAHLLGALVGLGVVAGLVPAWRALRTPVAENLQPVD